MNYYQARLYCQHLYPGTSLAEITSNVTQYLLTGAMAYYGFLAQSWWIGSSRTKVIQLIIDQFIGDKTLLKDLNQTLRVENFIGKRILPELMENRQMQLLQIGNLENQTIKVDRKIVSICFQFYGNGEKVIINGMMPNV